MTARSPCALDQHADVAGRVPGCRRQRHVRSEPRIGGDQIDQTRVDHRLDRIGAQHLIHPRVFALPVLPLGVGKEVAGVRKRRNPRPVDQAGVPSHVVDVEVGTQHGVDRLRWEAGCGQILEERARAHAPRLDRALLVVAEAGVDEDAPPVALDDQRPDRHVDLALRRRVVRDHPPDLADPVRGRVGEQPMGRRGRRQLRDLRDPYLSDRPHGSETVTRHQSGDAGGRKCTGSGRWSVADDGHWVDTGHARKGCPCDPRNESGMWCSSATTPAARRASPRRCSSGPE